MRGRGTCAHGAGSVVATMKPAGTTAPFTDADLPGVSFATACADGRPVGEGVTLPDVYPEPASNAGAAN